MNKKTIVMYSLGLAAILGIGALAGGASAYRGDYTRKGPNCADERHSQMEQVFNNNDYNAWKELMNGRGRVTQVINKSNFAQFAEAYKLAKAGNYDEADKIRQELGLRTRNGEPTRQGFGQGQNKGQGQGQGQGGWNRQ